MSQQKDRLRDDLVQRIEAELATIEKSAENAREAATHAESKPENKYDTRGLEASYLAGAQKERAAELRGALLLLRRLEMKDFGDEDRIATTALVELDQGGQSQLCLLMPWGAAYELQWEGRPVLTLTAQSPLGQALLGKQVGDQLQLKTGQLRRDYEVVAIF